MPDVGVRKQLFVPISLVYLHGAGEETILLSIKCQRDILLQVVCGRPPVLLHYLSKQNPRELKDMMTITYHLFYMPALTSHSQSQAIAATL